MAKKQLEKLMTGLAGEYLVAGYMNLKGWIASLTLKNFPCVDIFGQNNGKNISIQVKTSRETSFNIGLNHNNRSEIYKRVKGPFVFVYIDKNDNISFYILSRNDYINLVIRTDDIYFNKKKNKEKDSYPIAITLKDLISYKDQWDNLWI
ncbi:MAG: hypothetical protein IK103_04650 [Bacteroidales bacterium]|nr:hypothetical protein [Bacteroidales bacterium]